MLQTIVSNQIVGACQTMSPFESTGNGFFMRSARSSGTIYKGDGVILISITSSAANTK